MDAALARDALQVAVQAAVTCRQRVFSMTESLPELVEDYEPKESHVGRPKKEPFDPYKEITEDAYRRALSNAFANGVVSKYENLIPALQAAYEVEGFRLNILLRNQP